jgi:hypothetical protein
VADERLPESASLCAEPEIVPEDAPAGSELDVPVDDAPEVLVADEPETDPVWELVPAADSRAALVAGVLVCVLEPIPDAPVEEVPSEPDALALPEPLSEPDAVSRLMALEVESVG